MPLKKQAVQFVGCLDCSRPCRWHATTAVSLPACTDQHAPLWVLPPAGGEASIGGMHIEAVTPLSFSFGESRETGKRLRTLLEGKGNVA